MTHVTLSAKLPLTWRGRVAMALPGIVYAAGLMLFGRGGRIHGVELVIVAGFAGVMVQVGAQVAVLAAVYIVGRLVGDDTPELPDFATPYVTSGALLAVFVLVWGWKAQRTHEQDIRACVTHAVDRTRIYSETTRPGYTANTVIAAALRDCVSDPDEEVDYEYLRP